MSAEFKLLRRPAGAELNKSSLARVLDQLDALGRKSSIQVADVPRDLDPALPADLQPQVPAILAREPRDGLAAAGLPHRDAQPTCSL